MKARLYAIFYAVVLGVICAALLSGVKTLTNPRWKANKAAEEARNILGVLEVPFDESLPAEQLVKVREENLKKKKLGDLELYAACDPRTGETRALAVELAGRGAFGPIKGFLALDPEIRTIRGLTFHEHQETPGFGAVIATKEFGDRFKGKHLVDENGKPGIRLVVGASGPSEVDAISGATMTSDKVEGLLTRVLTKIVAERDGNAR